MPKCKTKTKTKQEKTRQGDREIRVLLEKISDHFSAVINKIQASYFRGYLCLYILGYGKYERIMSFRVLLLMRKVYHQIT